MRLIGFGFCGGAAGPSAPEGSAAQQGGEAAEEEGAGFGDGGVDLHAEGAGVGGVGIGEPLGRGGWVEPGGAGGVGHHGAAAVAPVHAAAFHPCVAFHHHPVGGVGSQVDVQVAEGGLGERSILGLDGGDVACAGCGNLGSDGV